MRGPRRPFPWHNNSASRASPIWPMHSNGVWSASPTMRWRWSKFSLHVEEVLTEQRRDGTGIEVREQRQPHIHALRAPATPGLVHVARMGPGHRLERQAGHDPEDGDVVDGLQDAEQADPRDHPLVHVAAQQRLGLGALAPLVVDVLAGGLPDEVAHVCASLVAEHQVAVAVLEDDGQRLEDGRRGLGGGELHHPELGLQLEYGAVEEVVVDGQAMVRLRPALGDHPLDELVLERRLAVDGARVAERAVPGAAVVEQGRGRQAVLAATGQGQVRIGPSVTVDLGPNRVRRLRRDGRRHLVGQLVLEPPLRPHPVHDRRPQLGQGIVDERGQRAEVDGIEAQAGELVHVERRDVEVDALHQLDTVEALELEQVAVVVPEGGREREVADRVPEAELVGAALHIHQTRHRGGWPAVMPPSSR